LVDFALHVEVGVAFVVLLHLLLVVVDVVVWLHLMIAEVGDRLILVVIIVLVQVTKLLILWNLGMLVFISNCILIQGEVILFIADGKDGLLLHHSMLFLLSA
jgi:hypothetical protein